jgi:hypothetical protein
MIPQIFQVGSINQISPQILNSQQGPHHGYYVTYIFYAESDKHTYTYTVRGETNVYYQFKIFWKLFNDVGK